VPQIAEHAARLGGHGWRRISAAAASANSGGRISRPVSAIWGRVARRPSGTGEQSGKVPHRHRLAWDFAVGTAALAFALVLHHQFRRSPRPVVADALVATTDVTADQAPPVAPAPKSTHRRRRVRTNDRPTGKDGTLVQTPASDPVALAGINKDLDAPKPAVGHHDPDHGADFGDHGDEHHAARPLHPPIDAQVAQSAPPLDFQPAPASQAPKPTTDPSLDSLLAAPVGSSAPHADSGAPVAQSEPSPGLDLDKPAHPHHSHDPLLVDSKTPVDSGPPKRDPLERAAVAGSPTPDEFAAPEIKKPHEHEHHKPKEESRQDDFSMPATTSAPTAPVDPPAVKEDEHHHKHHHEGHGPTDPPAGADLAAPSTDKDALAPTLDAPLPDAAPSKPSTPPPSATSASDPLLDVAPKLDAPSKDASASNPKTTNDKIEPSKANAPDDGLPVLSVPSPHKSDATPSAEPSKPDGPKVDDLAAPTKTANASDASIGGSPTDSAKDLPTKPPESKPPVANDPGLDDLLKTKVPDTSGPNAKDPGPAALPTASASTSAPAPKPTSPATDAAAKDDPFHTDNPPHKDETPHTDAPHKHVDPLPPESISPAPKTRVEPPILGDDEASMPSVAVAHHQIEKDETGASVRYKIVVRNNGKKPVKTFDVDEAVLAEHTVQATEPPAQTQDQNLHWTLRDMKPGEERTIVVTLTPPARPVEHQAEHHHPAEEPVIAPQTVPIAAAPHGEAGSPQLKLELITPVEVRAGESCRIGFRATNLGTKASDLKVNIDLPDQLHYTRGQQLEYKIGSLGDHEAREDYLTATASGTGQVVLKAEIVRGGHPIATAKGTCHVSPAGGARGAIQQTGASVPASGNPVRSANAADCLCWP
jgi:hypothetical protein